MEIDKNFFCFSEKWNMKGNLKELLMAEKAYRDAYANLLNSLDSLIKEPSEDGAIFTDGNRRTAKWLIQEIGDKDKDRYDLLVSSTNRMINVVKRIVPQNNNVEIEILNRLSSIVPAKNAMSIICFHSAINNVCEFVHLHRMPAKYKAAAVLVGVANKQLKFGAMHYIKILLTLINITQKDWLKAGIVEVTKLIGKNVLGCNPLCSCGVMIEEGIGLAELAYKNSTSPKAYILKSAKLKINDEIELTGKLDLPLHMGGYIAYCKRCNMYVVGFRGTENWENWITNISQHLVGVSLIYKVALGIVVKMKEKYGNRLLVVGHSLGGGLTQFAVAGLNDYHVTGLGYNSAGLSNMAADIVKNNCQRNIFHLHLRYDQVFYIGNQLGRCYDQVGCVMNPLRAHKLETMRNYSSLTNPPHFRMIKYY